MKNCHHFHMLNSIELFVRGDNLLNSHGNQHLEITYHPCKSWTSCHFMLSKVFTTFIFKMTHNQVSIGLLYSTFPLTAITFCHVSLNPIAVPKLFLQDLKKRINTTFRKKLRKIKMFVFEIAKVKVQ